jgi:hypothetical protein
MKFRTAVLITALLATTAYASSPCSYEDYDEDDIEDSVFDADDDDDEEEAVEEEAVEEEAEEEEAEEEEDEALKAPYYNTEVTEVNEARRSYYFLAQKTKAARDLSWIKGQNHGFGSYEYNKWCDKADKYSHEETRAFNWANTLAKIWDIPKFGSLRERGY